MSELINLSDEVEINQSDFISIDQTWIDRIKVIAKNNGSGKYRTCIHQSEKDNVHEMLIVHTSRAYVRPHKHRINGESLQFIEGVGTAIIFNEDGSITSIAGIDKDGKRNDHPKDDRTTLKKIK